MEAKGRNGTVTFDGQTVTINRKGFVARTTVGKGTKSIPVHAITAVQWKPAGMMVGYIQFTLSGGTERRSRFGKQSQDATTDENSVTFTKGRQGDFERVREAVQAAITNRHAAAPAPQQTSSVADELAKLVQLRDAGVLSSDEYEVQKARLLG
jgi:hypothetical protein